MRYTHSNGYVDLEREDIVSYKGCGGGTHTWIKYKDFNNGNREIVNGELKIYPYIDEKCFHVPVKDIDSLFIKGQIRSCTEFNIPNEGESGEYDGCYGEST